MSKKGPSRSDVTKELLTEMYYGDPDTSLQEVADRLGVSREAVRRWCKHFGIPMKEKFRHGGKRVLNQKLLDKEWLAEQLQTRLQLDIAEELGVDNGVVSYWARRHGLHNASRGEAIREAIAKKHPDGRTGEQSANWKGGRRALKSGYVRIYAPEHPKAHNGTVFEHRLVMEEKLGRLLEPGEVVHHIDGDKSNNHPDNLELKTHGDHIREHFQASHEVKGWRKRADEHEERILVLEKEVAQLKAQLAKLIA